MKKIAFTIDMVIYPFDVRFSFGETDAEVRKFLERMVGFEKEDFELIKFEDDGSTGRCVLFAGNQGIIRMRKIPVTPLDFATLHHEITHYVMFVLFDRIHMPHNTDTTEAYCYLTGYITKSVYDKLPKFKRLGK